MDIIILWFFFFFQAEDGIRDGTETGVQTCALPISLSTQYRAMKARISSFASSSASRCSSVVSVMRLLCIGSADEPTEIAGTGVLNSPNHYHRSEEHTSELQSQFHLVCRLLLEKKKK